MWRWFLVVISLTFSVNVNCLNEILRGDSILYGISTLADELRNTSICHHQMNALYHSIETGQVWAVKAMDASGRPTAGFLYGNNLWIGSHSQCKDISNTKRMEVSYERVKHADPTPYDYPPFPMKFAMAFLKHNSTLQHHTQLPLEFTIQLGLCIPKECEAKEISSLLKSYFTENYLEMKKLYQLNLEVSEVKLLDTKGATILTLPKTIIFWIIISVILCLTIIGTVYDVKQHNREKNMILGQKGNSIGKQTTSEIELVRNSNLSLESNRSTFGQIVKCFSFYSNVKSLVKTTLPSDSIASIHGIRSFGMIWVIMVHAVFYQTDYLANASMGYRLSEDIFAQILSNSTYCVDTYLFLSGFLLSYMFFKSKSNKCNDGKPVNYFAKVSEFVMMCVNRFLRLTPPYVIVIILTDILYTYYQDASSLLSSEEADTRCEKYWWRNILYINNLWPRSEMCLSWSWYLSVDTQFFTISSFLLILSTIAFKTAAGFVIALIIANVIATAYKSYSIGYIPTMDEQLNKLDAIYDLPWNRIGPYLMGVIAGYILMVKMQRKLVLRKRTRILLWSIIPIINLWILFTLYTRELSVEFSAVYMGVSRTLWGVGIAWLLIACCTGNARVLDKFLSFKGFVPFSRLTYCAYLLNPLVANMLYLGGESSLNASLAGFAITISGVTLLTFYLSFLFSMLFESPFILLTKMLFNKLTKRKTEKENKEVTTS